MPLAGKENYARSCSFRGPASKPDQRIGSCLPHIILAHRIGTSCHGARPACRRASCLQAVDFFLCECTELAGRNVQRERTITHTLDFFYVMAHSLKHTPDLTIASFDQRNFVPRVCC